MSFGHPSDQPPSVNESADPTVNRPGALGWLICLHLVILFAVPLVPLLAYCLLLGRLVQAATLGFWVIAGPVNQVSRVGLAAMGMGILVVVDSLTFSGSVSFFLAIYLATMAGAAGMVIAGRLALGWCNASLGQRARFSLAEMGVWSGIVAAGLGAVQACQDWKIDESPLDRFYGLILIIPVLQGMFIGMLFLPLLAGRGTLYGKMVSVIPLAAVAFLVLEVGLLTLFSYFLSGGNEYLAPIVFLGLVQLVVKLPLLALSLATILPICYLVDFAPIKRPADLANPSPFPADPL